MNGSVFDDATEDSERPDDYVDDGIDGNQVEGEVDDGGHVVGVPKMSSLGVR